MHARLEPAALDHELIDNAMEQCIAVKTFTHIAQEIVDRFRCLLGIELQDNGSQIGLHMYHRGSLCNSLN